MSKNATLAHEGATEPPGWAEISTALVTRLCPDDEDFQKELLRKTGAVSGFLRLAEQFEARFKRSALDDFIISQVADELMRPGHLHELLVKLPWNDIFTTNWDTLIERAADEDPRRRYEVVYAPDDLPITSRPRIFKLHGSVPHSKPFVFTEEDFRTYPSRAAPFVNSVQQAMMENLMVLIGFSGEDPNFLRWTGWVRDRLSGSMPRTYLVGMFRDGELPSDLTERLNIVPLNLRQIPDERLDAVPLTTRNDFGRRLEWWLRYLLAGEEVLPALWPVINTPVSSTAPSFAKVAPAVLTLDKLSSSPTELPASRAMLRKAIDAMQSERKRYPNWLIAPADSREKLWDDTEPWRAAAVVSGNLAGQQGELDETVRLFRFMRAALSIVRDRQDFLERLSDYGLSLEATVHSEDADADTAVTLRGEIERWRAPRLVLDLAEISRELIWRFDTALRSWPGGLDHVIWSLLRPAVAPDAGSPDNAQVDPAVQPEDGQAADAAADKQAAGSTPDSGAQQIVLENCYLVLQWDLLEEGQDRPEKWRIVELAFELGWRLLRRWREFYFHDAIAFDALADGLLAYAEAHSGSSLSTDGVANILHIRALYHLDRGQRQKARELLDNWPDRTTDPAHIFRLAGLWDQIALEENDTSALRNQAYKICRRGIRPNAKEFFYSSRESWLIAFALEHLKPRLEEVRSGGVGRLLSRPHPGPRISAHRAPQGRALRSLPRHPPALP